jgi:predicted nucleic acid-binding Zn ribbon protein
MSHKEKKKKKKKNLLFLEITALLVTWVGLNYKSLIVVQKVHGSSLW